LDSRIGDLLLRSTVLRWPIRATGENPVAQCVAGWAIGRGSAPSRAFAIDGSTCHLSRVRYYGEVWVASVGA
jgi:hypothetical protein